MSLHASIAILTARWKSERIELLSPNTESELTETFSSLGSKATGDVVDLYAVLGGMSEMDDQSWRLWSLREIKEENAGSTEAGVLFSDYLVNCYRYRLKPTDDSVSEVWAEGFDEGPPVRISESLEEFFASYIETPDAVSLRPRAPSQRQCSE